MSALLACHGLSAGHAGQAVVRDLDLALDQGEILAVLGPNGAGKTTLLSTMAGLLPAISGSVEFAGQTVRAQHPHRVARRGLALVPDDRSLFTDLTVRENLLVGQRRSGLPLDEVLALFPALTSRIDVRAGALSGGEQQMLALGHALIQRPRVLLLDEMSLGLAPTVVEALLPVLTQVADTTGCGIVLVEQHIALALEVATTALVLVHGEVVLRGAAAAIAADRGALEAAYLGQVEAGSR